MWFQIPILTKSQKFHPVIFGSPLQQNCINVSVTTDCSPDVVQCLWYYLWAHKYFWRFPLFGMQHGLLPVKTAWCALFCVCMCVFCVCEVCVCVCFWLNLNRWIGSLAFMKHQSQTIYCGADIFLSFSEHIPFFIGEPDLINLTQA